MAAKMWVRNMYTGPGGGACTGPGGGMYTGPGGGLIRDLEVVCTPVLEAALIQGLPEVSTQSRIVHFALGIKCVYSNYIA